MISKNKNKLILSLIILLAIFSFAISIFSEETVTVDEQLEQLKNILDSSSAYSAFQTRMLLNTVKDLIEAGIVFKDTKKIIENSVEESFDAYSVKKVFDIILDTQQEGLPTEPLINKVNEGFAKNVNRTTIISVISTKAENLKKAAEILNEAQQEGLEINGGEEIVKILADSLENDVPQESLSWLIKTGTNEGRNIEEITEISEELSYLSLLATDSGLSTEEISLLFKKATEDSSNIEEICENIQNSLETKISTAKTDTDGTVRPSAASDSGTLPSSPIESPVEVGETPTQEAGEAPTETGSAPEPPTSSDGDVPPPPEN
jgi:DNA-binding transcriptional MerR regulator